MLLPAGRWKHTPGASGCAYADMPAETLAAENIKKSDSRGKYNLGRGCIQESEKKNFFKLLRGSLCFVYFFGCRNTRMGPCLSGFKKGRGFFAVTEKGMGQKALLCVCVPCREPCAALQS